MLVFLKSNTLIGIHSTHFNSLQYSPPPFPTNWISLNMTVNLNIGNLLVRVPCMSTGSVYLTDMSYYIICNDDEVGGVMENDNCYYTSITGPLLILRWNIMKLLHDFPDTTTHKVETSISCWPYILVPLYSYNQIKGEG